MMKRSIFAAMMMSAALSFGSWAEVHDDENAKRRQFSFALIGDLQYNTAEEATSFPNLKADIDAHRLAFVVHDGDFKGGRVLCSDALFQSRHELFNSFKHPFVFLFGDNEWTDCHRTQDAAHPECGDPFDRLGLLRKLFGLDHANASLGRRTMKLARHSESFPEIVRWTRGNVMFVGLHVVGSNNGLTTSPGLESKAIAEYQARNRANIEWLRESFRRAKEHGSPAVMILLQANLWDTIPKESLYGFYGPAQGNPYAEEGIIPVLENEATTFGKPVVLVHGDSHYFRIDKPFPTPAFQYDPNDSADGKKLGPMPWESSASRLENFTRVETVGTPNAHWVKVTVDTKDPNVFQFEQRIVESNRVTR